jgi:hypothetical protein
MLPPSSALWMEDIFSETLESVLHDVASQNTMIVMFTVIRTSGLIHFLVPMPVVFKIQGAAS